VPGCEILARVDYESLRPDGSLESSESRLYMTSLDPGKVTPAELLQTIRNHWQVENCLHWTKDRWWDEDKHYLKRSGNVFITLTNWALSVLKLMQCPGDNIRATAGDVHFAPEETLRMLGFQTE
jgi:hypothetical protein